ncbi:FecR family protein [Dyadobacter arcticus]|uniref:Ferric-dicitrate binding protein FerR (Iron transport regulator) n=1 Tax=Dyadobacter arcticus TaxID=1078754 RepID=A0ABX0UER6_9BACT|nr:FecR family protein [Dyadobacter arcticus]NIJ51481.1 ferric-dicitrate binding protein FerR (iron transport regulator) [Dyadobacter arcticus]
MNNYKSFEVRDWLEDLKFQRWVYHGESDDFWQNFLRDNPLQVANIELAKETLLSVRGEQDLISEKEVKYRVARILEAIPNEEKEPFLPWWSGNWLRVAAIFLVMTGFGMVFFKGKNFSAQFLPLSSTGIRDNQKPQMLEVVNKTSTIRLVNLPDGSSVILKKNARISYPKQFDKDKREVSMTGEAFFEVVKNPEQPFLVYTGSMVTKVKGTSFSIRANDEDEEVKLVVKTGIVEVSANDPDRIKAHKEIRKIVLKPNEQVTFNRKSLSMVTKMVAQPVLIDLSVEKQDFEFKRTPLNEVFAALEKTYGLTIRFDKAAVSNCTITAKLGDEPVTEKLEMICAVVNAKFESRNGVISVTSGGCE